MKLIFKHITSYLMIAVVLVATLQLSVTKMTCLMTGKVVYSIEELEDCSPVKKGCNVDERCCDFHKITFDHTIESYGPSIAFSLSSISLFAIDLPQIIKVFVFSKPTLHLFSNLPPPLAGIELLKTIQVFRL